MFTLYTRPGCSACKNVKQLLVSSGKDWTEIDVSMEPVIATELVNAGIRSLPVLENSTGERFVGASSISAQL